MAQKKKVVEAQPSMLEQAMALLLQATAKNTEVLEKIATSLETPTIIKEHQIDLDLENKKKPFSIQMRYYVEARTQDLWDGIRDYEDPIGKAYLNRQEAVAFGEKNYWAGRYRILQIEAPLPSA